MQLNKVGGVRNINILPALTNFWLNSTFSRPFHKISLDRKYLKCTAETKRVLVFTRYASRWRWRRRLTCRWLFSPLVSLWTRVSPLSSLRLTCRRPLSPPRVSPDESIAKSRSHGHSLYLESLWTRVSRVPYLRQGHSQQLVRSTGVSKFAAGRRRGSSPRQHQQQHKGWVFTRPKQQQQQHHTHHFTRPLLLGTVSLSVTRSFGPKET